MALSRTVLGLPVRVVLVGGLGGPSSVCGADEIPLAIENVRPGAPITMGIPFPQGELQSPEHVRVLTAEGKEIPSQITTVTTGAPADSSLKWIWVFFFADHGDRYRVEYGPDVKRTPVTGDRIRFVNDQRSYGSTEITTGPLCLVVDQKDGGGVLDPVPFDVEAAALSRTISGQRGRPDSLPGRQLGGDGPSQRYQGGAPQTKRFRWCRPVRTRPTFPRGQIRLRQSASTGSRLVFRMEAPQRWTGWSTVS